MLLTLSTLISQRGTFYFLFTKYNILDILFFISVLAVTKTIKPMGSKMWLYVKEETVPPLTNNFFNGRGGQALEKTVGGLVDKVIEFCEVSIQAQEEEERRQIREKEEEIKRVEEKRRLEAEAIAKEKKEIAEAKVKAEAAKAKAEAEAAKAKSEAETAAKAQKKTKS